MGWTRLHKGPCEMTEKVDYIEIYPMRGHSRGEWYATLDDIAESEEAAEYWALFGVTHRGNKHCLGEFPTKSDAIVARQGVSIFGKEGRTKGKGRKVIQIEIVEDYVDSSTVELFALCNDGTIWRRCIASKNDISSEEKRWHRVSLSGINEDRMPSAIKAASTAISNHYKV